MTNTRQRLAEVEALLARHRRPPGHLEYWTAREYEHYRDTGERPARDCSEPCDPPVALVWVTGQRAALLSLVRMDVSDL